MNAPSGWKSVKVGRDLFTIPADASVQEIREACLAVVRSKASMVKIDMAYFMARPEACAQLLKDYRAKRNAS